ncbi:mitochondrial tRNA-specific 2-thiouridylase 1 isoform X1 [Plodia interpunctella]|uniref:mitochondrial tRNA-specific 2-thiouridylase 1 isoform X1 n=1 Tax=Plodia interpunctella TaxID=58824 RepID=UPI002367F2A0|nr:mitochondrial tRNA-specific 2-thiouridylase 1 isoform X1 [Plodia interpunctella]
MFKRIALGISGGVDSAVAALLLKRAGYHVEGVFMRNWDSNYESGFCSDEKDFEDATFVCRKLDIPMHRVYFIKEYWNEVFTVLLKEYESGLTPNPDILCNRYIKFDSFFEHCRNNLGLDAIATGHYANTSFGPFLEQYSENEGVRLLQPKDKFKDQTFFLSQVKQFSLRRCMFPLANLLKSQVREIAKSEGLLNVATKKDSTGICFIGKKRFQDFIEEYIETKRGNFIDIDTGQIVGEHSGLHKWTVGQRCCLADWKDAYFIFKKDLDTNNIYVVAGTNHPAIRNDICFTRKPHWIYNEPQELSRGDMLYCSFRFQHTKPLVPCRIVNNSEGLTIYLDRKLRAITEGQYGVLYKDGECLGSAKIADVCRDLIY